MGRVEGRHQAHRFPFLAEIVAVLRRPVVQAELPELRIVDDIDEGLRRRCHHIIRQAPQIWLLATSVGREPTPMTSWHGTRAGSQSISHYQDSGADQTSL